MLLLLTQMVFSQEIHVFLQISWIGILGTKRAYLYLENHDLQIVFLAKSFSVFTGSNMLHVAFLTQMVFFWEILVFLQLSWIALFEAKGANSTLKDLPFWKNFFQKLTQFSQGNKLLKSPASNRNVFRSRDTCISWTELNKHILGKMRLSSQWKLWFAGCILFKN
jgi:hypothetical protein